jgi:hypothetical protein
VEKGGAITCGTVCFNVRTHVDALHDFAMAEEGVSVFLALKTYDVRRVQLIFWVKDCCLLRGAEAPELLAEDLLVP